MGFQWKKEICTIPNLLSLFRLLLVPVYVTAYLRAETAWDHFLAGAILAVSCLTDAIDGKIARKFHMISHVGKVLDPLADKIPQFALTICLSFHYPALYPVLTLFVVKELFQLAAVIINLRKGKALSGALFAGKLCTTVLFVTMILMVLFPNLPEKIVWGIALLDFTLLSVSFLCYILAYFGKNKKLEDLHPEE